METEIEDTIDYRRKNKIKGKRGVDWYRFKDGIPPEDNYDYVWTGFQWVIDLNRI